MVSNAGKVAGLAVVGITGYYLYQANFNTKRAEILARQDFERMTNATEHKADDISAQRIGADIDKRIQQERANFDAKVEDAKKFARDSSDKVKQEADKLRQDANKSIDSAAEKSKGAVDSITGWFSGKK
jgi:hypothetical protein